MLPLLLPLVLAAPPNVQSRAEPAEVALGEPLRVIIEVRHPPAETWALPEPLALEGLTVRGVRPSREAKDGVVTTRWEIDAVVLDRLGEVEIPPIKLSSGGETVEVPGPPLRVKETSTANALLPPKPPQELLLTDWSKVAFTAAGVLALALLAWWIRRALRDRPKRAAPEAPPPEPEDAALAALAALERRFTESNVKEHYFALSEIVRTYLTARAGVPAIDLTTSELLEQLRRARPLGLDVDALESWLLSGDLVRFAKDRPRAEEARADLEAARHFVTCLRPSPNVEGAA